MTPIYLHRFERKETAGLSDILMAFCSTPQLDDKALAAVVTREAENNLAPDELIVVVRDNDAANARQLMTVSRSVVAFRERLLGRTTITLLAYDAVGTETSRVVISQVLPPSEVSLDELLNRGATAMFRTHGGFVEPSGSYHFGNPSKRHTDRFMRLSNILVHQGEIAFMAVAVMRFLPASAVRAYVDTPSLFAVVAAINDQWRSLDPGRPPLATDNFRSYDGAETYEFTGKDEAVALISASSSGGLAKRLMEKGFASERIVHVIYLGKGAAALKVAVDLLHDAKRNPLGYVDDREIYEPGDCKMCARGSVAIPLRGDQFDIQGPQPEPLEIKQKHAPRNLAELMRRIAGHGTLAIRTTPPQHWIKADRLFAAGKFLDAFDYHVRRSVPGAIKHCVIADEQSRPFAERVASLSGSAMTIRSRDRIDDIAADPGPIVDAVLVVAAVVGSGRVLLEISRDLRNVCPAAPIIYLVGLAKPTSQVRRESLRSSLVLTDHPVAHLLDIVDELVLPAPPTPNAWAEELGLLQETSDDWPEASRERLDRRRSLLEHTATEPLVDNLFLANDDARQLRLQHGFAFWPGKLTGSQADVFFTIAAILQQLRTAPTSVGAEALRTNWLQQTLLSAENFGRFNDGIIQASILRAARAAELDFSGDRAASTNAARIVRRILESAGRPRGEAAAEFLLAIATRRVRFHDDDLTAVLAPLADAPVTVQSLWTICRGKLDLPLSGSSGPAMESVA